jgi:hypothetical protein
MLKLPFWTMKDRMNAMHFLMNTLPRVSGEIALHVLDDNITRVLNIMRSRLLPAAAQVQKWLLIDPLMKPVMKLQSVRPAWRSPPRRF